MDETRLNREHSTRAKAQRKESWRPPELLPVPDPEPGYKFHWVRVSTLNTPDPINLSAKRREGWEPVKASEHPELHLHLESGNASKDAVVVGGLMLCKAMRGCLFSLIRSHPQPLAPVNNFLEFKHGLS